jgi:hypothetical protein
MIKSVKDLIELITVVAGGDDDGVAYLFFCYLFVFKVCQGINKMHNNNK